MKIEICEQMVQSWLANVKQCQVVQTNWTISPMRSIVKADIDDAYDFVTKVQDTLNERLNEEAVEALQASIDEDLGEEMPKKSKKKTTTLNITKKSNAKQFIRQCEIDVAGIRLDDGIVDRVYLVDSAFHKNGLGYHDVVATVIKKIIRAVLVSTIIFGTGVDVTVGFAAPECRDTVRADIENVVEILRELLVGKYSRFSIELYLNEKFSEEICKPLVENADKLNNDNDLFIRSVNILRAAEKHMATLPTPAKTTTLKAGAPKKSKKCPTITYTPADPDIFKKELMARKSAEIIWVYSDGTRSTNHWDASKINDKSSISGNIQSRPQWRSGKEDGLEQVFVNIK
ncbi:MAG: hypothetical protein IJA82_07165 [Clostridia bacterium]|nr:hypothetical protein [Clostridia bacterium]